MVINYTKLYCQKKAISDEYLEGSLLASGKTILT